MATKKKKSTRPAKRATAPKRKPTPKSKQAPEPKKKPAAKSSRRVATKKAPAQPAHALRGPWTVIYPAPDLAQAKAFYASLLEQQPYFDEVFYVGFNVGGFELGLDPDLSARGPGAAGGLAYWGVADVAAALQRALELGAVEQEPVKDVGGGIKVATVKDPFGSVIGLIENPNFGSAAAH